MIEIPEHLMEIVMQTKIIGPYIVKVYSKDPVRGEKLVSWAKESDADAELLKCDDPDAKVVQITDPCMRAIEVFWERRKSIATSDLSVPKGSAVDRILEYARRGESIICEDMTRERFRATSIELAQRGYKVMPLDFTSITPQFRWECLQEFHDNEECIPLFAETLQANMGVRKVTQSFYNACLNLFLALSYRAVLNSSCLHLGWVTEWLWSENIDTFFDSSVFPFLKDTAAERYYAEFKKATPNVQKAAISTLALHFPQYQMNSHINQNVVASELCVRPCAIFLTSEANYVGKTMNALFLTSAAFARLPQ